MNPGSPAAAHRLQPRDRIMSVNGKVGACVVKAEFEREADVDLELLSTRKIAEAKTFQARKGMSTCKASLSLRTVPGIRLYPRRLSLRVGCLP